MVKLFSKGKNGLVLDTLSDANGRFVFDNLAYSDSTKFVLQARTAKGQKDVEVKPDTVNSTPEIAAISNNDLPSNDMLAAYVQHSKKLLDEQDKEGINGHMHMLKEVTVKDKKIDPFENSTNLYGKGSGDQTLTADELDKMGYERLYDAVRAKATSIIFTFDHKLRSNRAVLPSFKEQKQDYMLVIVDGTPIFHDNTELLSVGTGPLDEIEAADVENVEIFLGAHGSAIYGSQASGGVVIVTTKKARKINNYFKESPGVITFKMNGFYKQREFYAPKYEHAATDDKPDLRTTIYWNPEFITDKDGNALLSYYNADGKGTYRVVIEGVDAEGNLGRQVLRYKVE
jgi:TonB-dependent SusC/RagA subfamily outer membrane receptor